MKNLGFAASAATALAAAAIGFGTPTQALPQIPVPTVSYVASVDHYTWLDEITPDVKVPKVDTSVRHSGR